MMVIVGVGTFNDVGFLVLDGVEEFDGRRCCSVKEFTRHRDSHQISAIV